MTEPEFEIKATGHVTATFKGTATPAHIANVVEWVKRQQWRGVLQINYVGNGGINSIVFAESPKALKENGEIK
jgi:hypothetical protein